MAEVDEVGTKAGADVTALSDEVAVAGEVVNVEHSGHGHYVIKGIYAMVGEVLHTSQSFQFSALR